MRRVVISVTAFFGVLLLLLSVPFVGAGSAAACTGRVDPVAAAALPPVAGYSGDQLANAAYIMSAATALGLDSRAQVVGVMTAMGESSLRNIDYGDYETGGVTNPDGSRTTSIGLFQQQDSWGTREERLDPSTSSRLFFERLVKVEGWENLTPSAAAHAVQINADPNHYTKWFAPAEAVVDALTLAALTKATMTCGNPSTDYPPSDGSAGPWGGYENGRIPISALQPIPWEPQYVLRADAAAALAAMNQAFRAQFGYDLPINDGYRDYAGQVEARRIYGDGAATPGQSNHGWALAIDIAERSRAAIGFGSDTYAWLKANAGRYGWAHPDWAEPSGSGPHEAWHWEYVGIK